MDNILTPQKIFDAWGQTLEADPKTFSRFAARYKWTVNGPGGGAWIIDCGQRPKVEAVVSEKTDFEIGLSSGDLVELVRGRLNPQTAFADRRLQVRGRMKYILRFNLLLDTLLSASDFYDPHNLRSN